jgi:hypothetical protein
LSDGKIINILNIENYELGRRALNNIRRNIGIYRRTRSITEREEQDYRMLAFLAEKLESDNCIDYFEKTILQEFV